MRLPIDSQITSIKYQRPSIITNAPVWCLHLQWNDLAYQLKRTNLPIDDTRLETQFEDLPKRIWICTSKICLTNRYNFNFENCSLWFLEVMLLVILSLLQDMILTQKSIAEAICFEDDDSNFEKWGGLDATCIVQTSKVFSPTRAFFLKSFGCLQLLSSIKLALTSLDFMMNFHCWGSHLRSNFNSNLQSSLKISQVLTLRSLLLFASLIITFSSHLISPYLSVKISSFNLEI